MIRNSKVRRRIAAGKLRLRIRDLRNLGPRSETMLDKVGIRSADALRAVGALEAFMKLRRARVTRSLNALWALVGALEPWPEGRDWREVAASKERLPLLLEIEARDKARQAVLRSAASDESATATSPRSGEPRSRGRSGKTGRPAREPGAPDATSPFGSWAPGLPFDEGSRAEGSGGAAPRTPRRRRRKN